MRKQFPQSTEKLEKAKKANVGEIHVWADQHRHEKQADGTWLDLETGQVTTEDGQVIQGHPREDKSLGEQSKKIKEKKEIENIKNKEQENLDKETIEKYRKETHEAQATKAKEFSQEAQFKHSYKSYLEKLTGLKHKNKETNNGSERNSTGTQVSKENKEVNGDFRKGFAQGTASTGDSLLDVFSDETEYSKAQEAEQNKRIVEWFKNNDSIFTPSQVESIGEQLPLDLCGAESILYRMNTKEGESQKILKAINLTGQTFGAKENQNNFQQQFDRIFIHNTLFPDTGYTIEGMMWNNKSKDLRLLISQPFVEGQPTDTMEKKAIMLHWLKNNGFKPVIGKTMRFQKGNLEIDDLHESNVLIDNQGQPRFIDPIIEIKNKDRYGQ